MGKLMIGNLIALLASILMVCLGFVKSKKQLLFGQCIQFGLMGISNFILGGFTGTVSNLISILRNLVCLNRPFSLPLKVTFIAVQFGITLKINTLGLLGWLPFCYALLTTWFLDSKSEFILKRAIAAGQVFWAIHDFMLHNYTGFAFDIFTILSNLIGAYRRSASPSPPSTP